MRNVSIDLLKVGCAVGIFLLHLSFLKNHLPIVGFIINQGIFRVAVPIFAIISGYYFYGIKDFHKLWNWVIRVGLLYIFWMLLYSPLWMTTDLKQNIIQIVTGYFILWYLASLIPAGILLFFIRKSCWLHSYSLAITLYLIGYIIQTIGHIGEYSGFIGWLLNFDPLHRNFLFDLLPMMIIGSKLQQKESNEGPVKPTTMVLIMALALVALEAAANYVWMERDSSYDLLLTLPFACAIIFVYVKNNLVINVQKKFGNIFKNCHRHFPYSGRRIRIKLCYYGFYWQIYSYSYGVLLSRNYGNYVDSSDHVTTLGEIHFVKFVMRFLLE